MARPMTLEQLQDALRKAIRPDENDPGFRVIEICEATGLSDVSVRNMIREGLKSGTVTRSSRMIERIDGKTQPATTFVFLEAGPKKARRG